MSQSVFVTSFVQFSGRCMESIVLSANEQVPGLSTRYKPLPFARRLYGADTGLQAYIGPGLPWHRRKTKFLIEVLRQLPPSKAILKNFRSDLVFTRRPSPAPPARQIRTSQLDACPDNQKLLSDKRHRCMYDSGSDQHNDPVPIYSSYRGRRQQSGFVPVFALANNVWMLPIHFFRFPAEA